MSQNNFNLLWPVAFTAAVVGLFFWERQTDRELNRQIGSLRTRAVGLVPLRHHNQELASIVSQLNAAELRRRKPLPVITATVISANSPKLLPPGYTALSELQNTGTDTPDNALKTYFWALDHGDLGALAGTLIMSDAARAKIDSVFSQLSPADQARCGGPEAMFALLYAYANEPRLNGLRINGETRSGTNELAVSLSEQFPRGQVRDHTISLYQSASGWKIPVLDNQVNAVVKQTLGASQ